MYKQQNVEKLYFGIIASLNSPRYSNILYLNVKSHSSNIRLQLHPVEYSDSAENE